MKIREEAHKKAKDAALAAGKSEAEAEQAGLIAGLQAENEFLAGDNAKGIEERQRLKKKLEEDAPFSERGRKAAESDKSAETRIAELEAENKRLAGVATEHEESVKSRLTAALGRVPEARRKHVPADLSPAKQLAWIENAEAEGLFGDPPPSKSLGGHKPARGSGNVVSADELADSGQDLGDFAKQRSDLKTGKATLG